jgi:pSer/pThr/pTyr-binding forkhead associated (FHA) protein
VPDGTQWLGCANANLVYIKNHQLQETQIMATTFRVTVQRGPSVGRTYELIKDVVTMGRDMSNDIVINDAESSRHHARLTKQGATYVVEDLGSTNGTFVNSARLSTPRPLSPGDVIGMGETIALTYEVTTTAATGATMIGSIDATVVASDLPSAREMQQMAAASAPPPQPSYAEPQPSSVPQSSFDLPRSEPAPSYSSSSYSSPPMSSSDFSSKPAGRDNTMMYVGIGAGVFLLCCCCPTLLSFVYAFATGMFGG